MPRNETTAMEPLTVDQKGKPPENRLTSAAGAWGAYQQAVMSDSVNDARFTSLRGCYDGMPPLNPQVQSEQGLADMPNINLRQMQAKVGMYVSVLTDLNCSGDKWGEVKLDPTKFENSGFLTARASAYVTDCFNEAIKRWDDDETENSSQFLFERTVADTQMGIFGIGALIFQDEIDWRPQAIPRRKIRVSAGTKLTLQNCQAMYWERYFTPSQLYGYVRDPETAKANGWNRESVIKLLYNKLAEQRPGNVGGVMTFAEMENWARNNDTWLNQNFLPIELVDVLVQEFNSNRAKDGVSHYIVSKYGQSDAEFLYERDRQYRSMRNAAVLFASETGPEGDYNGVKGFGDLIYDQCHLNNQLYNHVATMSIVMSSPLFQAGSDADRDKLSQMVISRMGILFPDVPLAQVKIQCDLEAPMAVLAETNRNMNTVSRQFPQGELAAAGEQPTATQVTFDRQDQAAFTTLQIKWYRLTGADPLMAEMYRRISAPASEYPESWPGGKTAKWFRDKMKEYGLKPDQYRVPKCVQATRSGGSGNPAIDSIKADEVMKVATPGKGQLNARAEKAAALYGHDRVNEFVEQTPEPIPEDVVIVMENATFQNGQFVAAFPFQDHFRHLGEASPEGSGHMAVLVSSQQVAQMMDDQGIENAIPDATKLLRVLQSTLEHCEMHVGFLASLEVNEPIVKPLAKVLSDMRGFIINFEKAIQKAVETQQQSQPQVNPEIAAMQAKTQAEIEMKQQKTLAEIAMKQQAMESKLANMAATSESRNLIHEQQANQQLGIQAQQALIDHERERSQLASDLAAQQIKTAQEVAAAEAKTRAKSNAEKAKKTK